MATPFVKCPFCLDLLPSHTRQCRYGSIPRADHIEQAQARKSQSEKATLNKAMLDDEKSVVDHNGKNLKRKNKGEQDE